MIRCAVAWEYSPLRELQGVVVDQRGDLVLVRLDILPDRLLTFARREITPA